MANFIYIRHRSEVRKGKMLQKRRKKNPSSNFLHMGPKKGVEKGYTIFGRNFGPLPPKKHFLGQKWHIFGIFEPRQLQNAIKWLRIIRHS